jgi:hypothetical protein
VGYHTFLPLFTPTRFKGHLAAFPCHIERCYAPRFAMISPASTTGFFTLKLASKFLHFSSTFCQANFKKTLLLFALTYQFLQQIIEGDELYTRVKKNVAPDESQGWTIVLMDRATRFLWEMHCGRKDRKLFKLTSSGRTRALARCIPWSRRCILDTPSWACRQYIPREIWPHRQRHQRWLH